MTDEMTKPKRGRKTMLPYEAIPMGPGTQIVAYQTPSGLVARLADTPERAVAIASEMAEAGRRTVLIWGDPVKKAEPPAKTAVISPLGF
jgi:hypothetical protein